MSGNPITSNQPNVNPLVRRPGAPLAPPTTAVPATPGSPAGEPGPRIGGDRLNVSASPAPSAPELSDVARRAREAQAAQAREARIQEVLREAPPGIIGESINFWNDFAKEGGAKWAVGKAFVGLLEFSGLASVERSAGELGARVGADDSAWNITKSAGKLAFDSGIVILNGLAAGKAVASGVKAVGAAFGAGETAARALPQVVRHYTSAAAAESIMKDGVLYASKAGSSGFNKIYFLAEEGANAGMNFLRRLNIGHLGSGRTAAAIEVNLSKLPPAMLSQFERAAANGIMGLEKFVTHSGSLNLKALGDAVRVVDAGQMAVTAEQLLRSGATLLGLGSTVTSANRAAGSLAQ